MRTEKNEKIICTSLKKTPAKSNRMERKRDIQCVLGSILYTVISLSCSVPRIILSYLNFAN